MVAIDRLRKNYVQSHTDNLSGADHLSSKKNLARKTAPKDLEFGRRFFLAWKDLEKREEKDIPFAEIGARVPAAFVELDVDAGPDRDQQDHEDESLDCHGVSSLPPPFAGTCEKQQQHREPLFL